MRSRRAALGALLVTALVLGACGGGGSEEPQASNTASDFASDLTDVEAYPYFISSEVLVGENRFLIGLLDSNDAPVGSPDIEVSVDLYDLATSDEEPVSSFEGDFIWTVPRERGVYVIHPEFSRPGEWGAEVDISGGGLEESVRGTFEVTESGPTPALGAPAPASNTPTADDVDDLAEISTDDDPNPRFYRKSIAEALAARDPFVVVFSTPKFCASAVCGPTLDAVKAVARDHRQVTFIHSEIYEGLEPTNPPTEAVREWGLPGEPWVFVVDVDGRVAAKFEGVAAEHELDEALSNL